jgi:hypothetical protein
MRKIVSLALALSLTGIAPAFADSSDQMLSALEAMKHQIASLQKTVEQQNIRIQQLESSRSPEVSVVPQSGPVSGSAISDADWQKGIKDNLGEAIPWLKGLKQGGDFRLRYEVIDFEDNNSEENISSDRTRNRFRIRLRWGVEKDFGDDWKAGFRLATGSATDQASTNVTLGNPGHFTYKTFLVDRAYALYSPNRLKDYGPLKGVTIGAGKFENPFSRYSTPIVWDSDVTPEGAYEKATFQLIGTEENKLNLNAVAGQFIANENSGFETDADIYGYQGALTWSTDNFGTDQPVELTGAASWYEFNNWSQTIATNTAGTSFLRTNTLVADNFRILDLYPELAFVAFEKPVTLWYNYVENMGNVGTGDLVRSGGNDIHDADTAWGLGFKVGRLKKKGDWEAFYGYYEIGANAVVAAFNDSDFGGPGGTGHTNRQGHKLGLGYQLADAVTVNWTGYVVDPLNSGTVVASSVNERVFRSQFDVNYKF